jgi:excisionase family DNA binding protein
MKKSARGLVMGNIVTAKELSRYLKLTESTIYKLVSGGEIPGFKIGDCWRFDMDEILKLIRGVKKKTRNGKESRFSPADAPRESHSPEDSFKEPGRSGGQ